jgi:hypothetical protein
MKFDKLVQTLLEMHGDTWAETAWIDTKDGKEIKVTIGQILDFTKNIPTTEVDTESLRSIALHNNKTDKETLTKIQKANLDYPILIIKKKDGVYKIIDGHHRLQKALNNKIPKIKAKVIDINTMPEDWQRLLG